MITYRTFSAGKWVGLTPEALLDRWETVRAQARVFIERELEDDDVVSISESAFGNSPYGFTVTVWHRKG